MILKAFETSKAFFCPILHISTFLERIQLFVGRKLNPNKKGESLEAIPLF